MGRFARILICVGGLGAFLWLILPQTGGLAVYLWDREWIVIMGISAAGLAIYGALALALGAVRLADYKTGPGGK